MRLVFMGTPQAAVPSLERLISDGHEVVAVYSQPDRPSGRGNKITFSPVKLAALAHGIPVLQPTKIKTEEALARFKSHEAHAAIVVAYGRILPPTFLTAFTEGAINVHFSLLPKYRGAAPVNWAIVNGEAATGITTMQMDEGLDTGPILMQRRVQIAGDETSVDLMERLSAVGADLLSETLADLNRIEAREQDHNAASFAPIMRKEDGKVDWQMPASAIVDRVRGFQPFPTAFTFADGQRITFWKGEALTDVPTRPGVVFEAGRGELLIGCGSNTAFRVIELQPEGKRRMDTRDFVNSGRVKAGDVFGS